MLFIGDNYIMSIQQQFSRVGQILQHMGYNVPSPPALAAPPELSPIQSLAQRVQAVHGHQPLPALGFDQYTPPSSPVAQPSSGSVPAISLGFSGGPSLIEVEEGETAIKPGDTGSGVKAVQRFLSQQGHSEIIPSGYFDERTRAALEDFQNEQGIITDGVVGPQTLDFMKDPVVDSGLKDYKGRPIRGTQETVDGYKKIIEIASSKGYRVQANSSYRTYNEQQKLWTQALRRYGSASAARKWVAPPGKSRHNAGNAIDMNMFKPNGSKISDREFASIIDQAGMYRPMSWEPWHVEPKSTGGARDYAHNDHGHDHAHNHSDDSMWV